jgi:hypothetical protein
MICIYNIAMITLFKVVGQPFKISRMNGRILVEPLNEVMPNGVIDKHLPHKYNANHLEKSDL